MAAAWSPSQGLAVYEQAPIAAGVVGYLGVALSTAQGAPGGQSQTQRSQSQEQALPDPDDDLEIDDDPFFADEPETVAAPASAAAPASGAAPQEEVIEIEVPEGYVVEYEIVDGDASATVVPAPTLQPAAPAPVAAPSVIPTVAPRAVPVRPAEVTPAMTSLELRSRKPAAVERYDRRRGGWVPVCVAPCRAEVPAGSLLRVPKDRNHDVSGSRTFRLDEDRASVRLDIKPGSRKQRWAGVGAALISASGVAAGALMIHNTVIYDGPAGRSYEGAAVVGMASITLIAGVVLAVTGKSRIREGRSSRVAMIPGGVAF